MFSEKDLIFQVPERSVLDFTSGGFAQQILVVAAAEPGYPGNRDFLAKILAAARLDLEKDTLFAEVPAGESVSLLPAIKHKHAGHILVFGLSAAQLGIVAEITPYQPQIFYGATFLFADALSVLEPDKTRKGNLWLALRQIFL